MNTPRLILTARWQRVTGAVLILLALLTIVTAAVAVTGERAADRHQRQVTACQARYNNAFARNIIARAQYGARDSAATFTLIQGNRSATFNLIRTVFSIPPTAAPAAAQQLLLRAYRNYQATEAATSREYQDAETAIERERRAHPFPALPGRACR